MTSFTVARSEALAELVERDAMSRLLAADHTLWRDDPTEVADRLGWMPVVAEGLADLPDLTARCDRLVEGIDDVFLMGMGGSSLFPEVLSHTFEPAPGRPRLRVLDSTDPAAMARVAATCTLERTLFLAASKSGSTVETRSHLEWAWSRAGGSAPFAVITDPGSELGGLARDRSFLEVFENRPDIGGRYSALSQFGIVPALLMGADAAALLQGGLDALDHCGTGVPPEENPALQLAATLTGAVRSGRDKATFVLAPALAAVGLWIEQLVAESLGKGGTGIVPVVDERLGSPNVYGTDRVFLSQRPLPELEAAGHPTLVGGSDATPYGLGQLLMTMELAVALTGAALGVQPFDQPDVAAAKAATEAVLAEGGVDVPPQPLAGLLDQLRPGDHLALQVFADPGDERAQELDVVRTVLRDRHRVAVSLGFGPRFLHSPGQLHKGGPPAIVCVQAVGDDPDEIPIPGRSFGFGHLKQAQAAGDLRTLQARGIRAGRVELRELLEVAR